MAASLWVCGRPFLPPRVANYGMCGSSQTVREPRWRKARLSAGQLVVRYFGRVGVLMNPGYQA